MAARAVPARIGCQVVNGQEQRTEDITMATLTDNQRRSDILADNDEPLAPIDSDRFPDEPMGEHDPRL